MLYLHHPNAAGRIVVLETDEIEQMAGDRQLLTTPDKSIVIGWTPDRTWLDERLRTGMGTLKDTITAIVEAYQRPQINSVTEILNRLRPGRPMLAAEREPYLRAALLDMWNWQKGCQELLPDALADRVKSLLGVE